MKTLLTALALTFVLLASPASIATANAAKNKHSLPEAVIEAVGTTGGAPLARVGTTTYRKLMFTIYHATLWAPNGVYNPKKPYALQIEYTRDISQETLVEAVASDVKAHEQPDEATMAAWKANLYEVLPSVNEGQELIGVFIPGQRASLYFNGKRHSTMKDRTLSNAFFGIWLGEKADADVRAQLTNTAPKEDPAATPQRRHK